LELVNDERTFGEATLVVGEEVKVKEVDVVVVVGIVDDVLIDATD